jgi:type IV pilus assembly protein PilO
MTLDELRTLDVNNPSSWPFPVKIGAIGVVCAVILFFGYWFVIKGELEEYGTYKEKEAQLRETYMNKKALAINLPAYRQQMEEMQRTFGTLLRQLPNRTEVESLLVDVTQAGLGRGVDFVLFKKESEQPKEFYAELPINLKVTGSYHELANFVSDVAALPRIVTLEKIDISTEQKTGRLTMAALAKTYRYLEQDEIEEQLKAKKAAQKKGGKKPAANKGDAT